MEFDFEGSKRLCVEITYCTGMQGMKAYTHHACIILWNTLPAKR
jgi:hypothetical protein